MRADYWSSRPNPLYPAVCLRHMHVCFEVNFYLRGASGARVLAFLVCLSVCLSHAGIVAKRLTVGSCKQRHVIAQGL